MLVVNASLIRKELERASSTSSLNFLVRSLKEISFATSFCVLKKFWQPNLSQEASGYFTGSTLT